VAVQDAGVDLVAGYTEQASEVPEFAAILGPKEGKRLEGREYLLNAGSCPFLRFIPYVGINRITIISLVSRHTHRLGKIRIIARGTCPPEEASGR
jgi:hypothetical protein